MNLRNFNMKKRSFNTMKNIIKEIYSLEYLWLSSKPFLWMYRIGITLIAIAGIVKGLSEFNGEGLFTVFIETPFYMILFRVVIEMIFMLSGIYKKLSSIDEKLPNIPQSNETPPEEREFH